MYHSIIFISIRGFTFVISLVVVQLIYVCVLRVNYHKPNTTLQVSVFPGLLNRSRYTAAPSGPFIALVAPHSAVSNKHVKMS